MMRDPDSENVPPIEPDPKREGRFDENTPESRRRELDELYSAAFEELSRLASSVKRRHGNPAVSTGTLVNAAWLQLAKAGRFAPESEQHFRHMAAQAMRHILVEMARRRYAAKRGGGNVIGLGANDVGITAVHSDADLLTLDAALDRLKLLDCQQAQIVEESFFGGLEDSEIAACHAISLRTVSRKLRGAKAWLAVQLRPKKAAATSGR